MNAIPITPPNLTPELVEFFEDEVKEDPAKMSWARAWLEYTGIPAMIAGGLGAFGINVAFQASQVRTGTSMFSAARYGFGLALILEASIGAALIATIFNILDTQDLHAGGLTNEPLGKTLYDNSPSKQIEESNVPTTWKLIWISGQ